MDHNRHEYQQIPGGAFHGAVGVRYHNIYPIFEGKRFGLAQFGFQELTNTIDIVDIGAISGWLGYPAGITLEELSASHEMTPERFLATVVRRVTLAMTVSTYPTIDRHEVLVLTSTREVSPTDYGFIVNRRVINEVEIAEQAKLNRVGLEP